MNKHQHFIKKEMLNSKVKSGQILDPELSSFFELKQQVKKE